MLGHKLPFDSLPQLRAKLYAEFPHMAAVGSIEVGDAAHVERLTKLRGRIGKGALVSPVKDFYLTNPIARASAVMAECSALHRGDYSEAAE